MVKMLSQRVSTVADRIKPARTTVSETRRLRGSVWMDTRARILRRDAGLCQPCKAAGRLRLGFEVDHIEELADGGSDDDTNLQTICRDCHKEKTDRNQRARQGR